MLTDAWSAVVPWFQAALAGQASPVVIAIALVLTTLLLEDLAIAAGVALAAQGLIGWPLSLLAVGGGIAAGDLGLYAAGAGARRLPWLRQRLSHPKAQVAQGRISAHLPSAILLARVIPGLRLATYTACGALHVSLPRFTVWVLIAVSLWTLGLYALSAAIGDALARAWGLPPAIAVALPIALLAAVPVLWHTLQRLLRKSST